jgi:gluconate 2-dehydrogenase alpha chain
MSTVITEPAADVVLLGLGVMSGAISAELTKAGYTVAGIEKGPYWDYSRDFPLSKYDEWGISMMRKFDHPLWLSSFSIRNNNTQYANPVRKYTYPIQYHALGHGVGGAAHHYGGGMGRFGPWTYQAESMTASRYGPNYITSIEPNADLQDFPMTYEQYDPFYVQWEQAYGVCGPNQGPLVPFYTTGYQYPMKAHPLPQLSQLFITQMEAMGYNPYPAPNSLASEPYMNQYGIAVNACVYDGWCGELCNYVCETGAKANSANRTIPAAVNSGKFTMAINSYINRIDTNSSGLATDVRYTDQAGNVHIQPGTVFFNGLWGMNMYRMMALSGIGNQYNPTNVSGSLGRGWTFGYAPYIGTAVSGTVNIGGNAYSAGNAAGSASMFDVADDNFDHTGLGFIGGATIGGGGYLGGGPSALSAISTSSPSSLPGSAITGLGSTFKATLKNKNLVTKQGVGGTPFAPQIPTTQHYFDLDPHHTDIYGDPLTRGTLDWGNNEFIGATYIANKFLLPIAQKLGATNAAVSTTVAPGAAHTDWWGHHQRGAMRTGKDASSSVFNLYMQSWTCENLFAAGEICNTFGTYVTAGTHPGGALSYVAAEGIKKYLASPGALA